MLQTYIRPLAEIPDTSSQTILVIDMSQILYVINIQCITIFIITFNFKQI